MSTTQVARNKAALGRLHHALNSGDEALVAAVVNEVLDPAVRIDTPLPIDASGRQALNQVWATLMRAFPDLRVTVDDLFGEDDRLVARNTVTGTHLGDYLGIAPTGRSVRYREIFICRFAHGRITDTWGVADLLAQLKQLGALADDQHAPSTT